MLRRLERFVRGFLGLPQRRVFRVRSRVRMLPSREIVRTFRSSSRK